MPALANGSRAPHFSLPADDGRSTLALPALLAGKGAIVAFFKTTCPTCVLEFPFVERMSKALSGSGIPVVGIGQDPAPEISSFRSECGLSFPIASDLDPYPVSDAYGLTTTPTLFLVDAKGTILRSEIGFSKDGLESLHREALTLAGAKPSGLFRASDDVPPSQPG